MQQEIFRSLPLSVVEEIYNPDRVHTFTFTFTRTLHQRNKEESCESNVE